MRSSRGAAEEEVGGKERKERMRLRLWLWREDREGGSMGEENRRSKQQPSEMLRGRALGPPRLAREGDDLAQLGGSDEQRWIGGVNGCVHVVVRGERKMEESCEERS